MAQGKIKKLDCLYLFRQDHPHRTPLPDAFDWLGASRRGVPAWRKLARAIPGARQAWRAARPLLPGEERQVSLEALSSPRSRFREEFLPVWKSIGGCDALADSKDLERV